MVKVSPEAKVGLFVLIGVILLTYMTFTVSGLQWGGEKGYRLFATLDTVAGLEEKGWRLRQPVQRIWAGERDAAALTAGVVALPAAATQQVDGAASDLSQQGDDVLVVGAANSAGQAVLLDWFFPVISGSLVYLLLIYVKYLRTERQRKEVIATFGRYLSPVMVEPSITEPRTGGKPEPAG